MVELNHFIKKSLAFVLFLALFGIACHVLNQILFNKYNYAPHLSTEILIMGDSHARGGIIEKIIPNSENIGHASEPITISYFKLKDILSNQNAVNQVILSFSPYNISSTTDYYFTDKRWANEMLERLTPMTTSRELLHLKPNPKFLLDVQVKNKFIPNFCYLTNVFRKHKLLPYMSEQSTDARFKNIQELRLKAYSPNQLPKSRLRKISSKKLQNITNVHFHYDTTQIFSHTSTKYLGEIIKLTKEHNIKLLLVSMPMHSDYVQKIPEKLDKIFNANVKRFLKHKHVDYLNLTTSIEDDRYFRNHDHINGFGALIATDSILTHLNLN